MHFSLEARPVNAAAFRRALMAIPERDRDAWLDDALGLEGVAEDGAALPRGCVPYLPSGVGVLLRLVELTGMSAGDVFVDVGCGVGRALALIHLLTGASAVGVEIQPELVRQARELATRLDPTRIGVSQGDAAALTGALAAGTVFFLYCPFSGERLGRVLDALELIARQRVIHVCSVDLPLPERGWLAPLALAPDLAVYRSLR